MYFANSRARTKKSKKGSITDRLKKWKKESYKMLNSQDKKCEGKNRGMKKRIQVTNRKE